MPKFELEVPHSLPLPEVKSRFATRLFDKLTITNSAGPMARATAELGAAFLLYCARDVDRYRDRLRKPSNREYSDVHLHGTAEFIANREVAMIGFGRVGRALVDLLRGFDLRWIVYDPFAPRALGQHYPVFFSELKPLLRRAQVLVLTAALTERTRGLLDRKSDVFFGEPTDHVAFWLGDGRILHATARDELGVVEERLGNVAASAVRYGRL